MWVKGDFPLSDFNARENYFAFEQWQAISSFSRLQQQIIFTKPHLHVLINLCTGKYKVISLNSEKISALKSLNCEGFIYSSSLPSLGTFSHENWVAVMSESQT